MDSVMGIDLSGLTSGSRGRTVVAQVALAEPPRLLETFHVPRRLLGDRLLVEWIEGRHPLVVGIDAPLSLPHSIECTDPRCDRCALGGAEYLTRDVDRLVAGMPTAMLAAIAFRGIYLARKLRERGYRVIEAYPAAAYRAMGALGRAYAERAELLSARIGDFASGGPDETDAICAALIAANAARTDDGAVRGVDGEIWRTLG